MDRSRKANLAPPPSPQQWDELRARLREGHESASHRVLCLDSSRTAAARFRRAAESFGWCVDVTADATEAFGLSLSYRYQAILLPLHTKQVAHALESLRQAQPEAAFILVADANKRLSAVPAPDPGIVGLLQMPWSEATIGTLLERAAQLSAARRRFSPDPTRTLRCAVRALWVGDQRRHTALQSRWCGDSLTLQLAHARTLAAATTRLDEESYDLVLTDLTLPDAWGLDSVVRLVSHPSQLPVVVVTGVYDEALISQILRLGAANFVPFEPVNPARLEAAVIGALTR